jgi:hypothetical protein
MSADVGFEDPQPETFDETENRRHAQDSDVFRMMVRMFPTHGFTAENLCVLIQPQLQPDTEDFEIKSYMESLRDLVRFIDGSCRTRKPPGFAWMNSILTSVAGVIDRIPEGGMVDITKLLQAIYNSWADDTFKAIIGPAPLQAQDTIARLSLQAFPFGNALNPRFVADAIATFDANCIAWCETIFEDIPDKAECLRQDLRNKMQAVWSKAWSSRREILISEMVANLTSMEQRLASQARNEAIRVVSELAPQTAFEALSPDLFYRPVIDAKVAELRRSAQQLHPECLDLIGDRFSVMQHDLQDSVRTAVEPHWRNKKTAAQRWNEDKCNEKLEAELQRQALEFRLEAQRREEENRRREEERDKREDDEKKAQELKRKRERPESLTELMDVKEEGWDPAGTEIWLYPGGQAGLKFRVSSYSPRDSRLQLIQPTGLSVQLWYVSTTLTPEPGYPNMVTWNNYGIPVTIPFYIDGDTMGIVFTTEATVGPSQSIYINLPPDTDIENLPDCGYFIHWFMMRRPDQVYSYMNTGIHNRGPRIQSDHHW